MSSLYQMPQFLRRKNVFSEFDRSDGLSAIGVMSEPQDLGVCEDREHADVRLIGIAAQSWEEEDTGLELTY